MSDAGAPDLRPFSPVLARRWFSEDPGRRHLTVDGTLVFVDISGFTAMSERLNRLGRVGAEEVTALLNEMFTALLDVAYDRGGNLLKFGGDALLVQFDGDDHVARGTCAAWEMRAALRAAQPLSSSAGKVHLRMSVGVHTGRTDHVLVGTTHRELLVVGPVASGTVRYEGQAGAGQIVVSPEVAAALSERIRTRPAGDGDGVLLVAPPRVGPTPLERPATDPASAGALLPVRLRTHLATGDVPAEHRPAVVAFVKFAGVDPLFAEGGPDAVVEAVEQLVATVTAAAEPEDVCVLASDIDADGGKLILTAGVPESHEHDGERMLRALRSIVEADLPLPVKVGAHRGLVFCGAIGPPHRLTYTIIGDTVNLAARVMSQAGARTVLATAAVLERCRSGFEVTEQPPFKAKGKRDLVVAYEVGPRRSARPVGVRGRFPLVGRDAEVEALLAEAAAARAGTGRVVELVGPAGMGKSRLVEELRARASEQPVVQVGCSRYEASTPYHAVAQLLCEVLGLPERAGPDDLHAAVDAQAPALVAWLPLLGDVLGIDVPDTPLTTDLGAGFRTQRTVQAVEELLAAVLPTGATIVVEDVHWADPETWTTLVGLAQAAVASRPWLVVATARHPLALASRAGVDTTTVTVEPLGPDAGRALVYAAVEEGLVSLDRGLVLLERAAGNPFFLQELLTARGGDDLELPDSVDALVQDQLDRLPVPDRTLLADASVLGVEVDVQLLASVLGDDPEALASRLGRLGEFVEPLGGATFRFRHGLVHDGAYGRLPFRRRRDLHRSAASAIESDPGRAGRADLLSLHTYRAGAWEPARGYALTAARQAAARFANLTAAEQYRHALASSRQLPGLDAAELATTWEDLGDVLLRASAYEDAAEAYRRAKALAPRAWGMRLCGKIGQLRERQGRYVPALWWYGRALSLDDGAAVEDRARILVERAIVRARQGRADAAEALVDEASTLTADTCTQARVAYVRAWCAMLRGEDGRAHEQRCLELFVEAGDLVGQGLAFNISSMAAYCRGDWHEAAPAYERAGAIRRRVGDEVAAAVAAGNLGELYSDQGRFDDARGLLLECRAVCRAAGFRSSELFATMVLGRLHARLGDFDAAEDHLVAARDGLVPLAMAVLDFDAARYLAELEVFRGDHERALAAIEALAAVEPVGNRSLRTVAGRLRTCVLLEQGAVAAARDEARLVLLGLDDDGRDFDTALGLAVAATALDEAGDARAVPVRQRADALLDRLGLVVPVELLVFGPRSERAQRAVLDPLPTALLA